MDTKTIIIICAVVAVVLIISITVYILTRGNYTRVLCGSKHFEGDFASYVSNTKLPLSQEGNRYSYSFWLYIINLPENSEFETDVNYDKPILYRYGSPNISYNTKLHRLRFQIAYKDNLDMVNYYNLDVDKTKVQTWTNYVLVVNDRHVSIYENGKLLTGAKIPHVPFIFNRNIYLGEKDNNFNGYVAEIKYFNKALKQDAIKALHGSRPSLPNISN